MDDNKDSDFDDEFDTEDFDTGDFDDGGFDDFEKQEGTLGDLWRNNPMVKTGVIIGGLAVLILGIILFSGKSDRLPSSRVVGGKDITEAPGTGNVTDAYKQAIEEENTRRIEEAIRQSESAVPMPVEPVKGTVGLQFEEPEEEDPLERWRRMQEQRIQQQQIQEKQQPEAIPEPVEDTRTPAVNAMAQAMARQMESVLGNQQIERPNIQNVATIAYLEDLERKEQQKLEEALAKRQELLAQTEGALDELEILLPAGTIEYAQLLIEANTDAPGPILAQINTGPLRGAKVIGSFTSTDNFLTLNFSTVVIDGVDYPVSGVAIDPETTLPGVVTDIDRRYIRRVVLPMAAEFITGLTSAIASSGQTTVTINGDSVTETTSTSNIDNDQEVASGLAKAGEELANILDEAVDSTEPLLRVRAGTPIGILFTSSVTNASLINPQQPQPQPATTATNPLTGILPIGN